MIIYHFCEIYLSSKDFLEYYKWYYITKNDYFISMEVYNRIVDYITTLNLHLSQKIIASHDLISELKIIKKKFKYNFLKYKSYTIFEYNI